MNLSYRILIMLLLGLLVGCTSGATDTTAAATQSIEGQFEHFLNLDPSSIAVDLAGDAENRWQPLLSKGYFTYIADADVLTRLQQHNEFKEVSEFNQTIRLINCTTSSFPTDFTYWTEASITTTERACYMGIFFPYVHYLVHDPATSEMQHFVTGMRD